MRTVGWFYLTAYTLDAMLSLAASVAPRLQWMSDGFSSMVLLLTFSALILAALNKLTPRKTFFILGGYHLLMLVFGIVVANTVLTQVDPLAPERNVLSAVEFLKMNVPWYLPTHWTLLTLWSFLAAYGWITFLKKRPNIDKTESQPEN